MRKKYRMSYKIVLDPFHTIFCVQVRPIKYLNWWITIKSFEDIEDEGFALSEAHELLDHLRES